VLLQHINLSSRRVLEEHSINKLKLPHAIYGRIAENNASQLLSIELQHKFKNRNMVDFGQKMMKVHPVYFDQKKLCAQAF